MAEKILDYKASVPNSNTSTALIPIPASPTNVQLADLGLFLSSPVPMPNRVRLIATIGIHNLSNDVVQVLFRVFRDGNEIFNTQQGLEDGFSERNYTVSLQALDFNVSSGFHKYTLTAEGLTLGDVVIGPITFTGLAIGPID